MVAGEFVLGLKCKAEFYQIFSIKLYPLCRLRAVISNKVSLQSSHYAIQIYIKLCAAARATSVVAHTVARPFSGDELGYEMLNFGQQYQL